MKNLQAISLLAVFMVATAAASSAAPISEAESRVIPSAFEQIVSVDYRSVQASQVALALKAVVYPETLGKLEAALAAQGMDVHKDLGSLLFATFRDDSGQLKAICVATGSFSTLQKNISRTSMSYRGSDLYLLAKAADEKSRDLDATFLDSTTLLFGEREALESAIGVLNGDKPQIGFNRKYADIIRSIDKAPVWSVLSRSGSLRMIRAALGNSNQQEEYDRVKSRILGADYTIKFEDGVQADLTLLTLDPESSADLVALLCTGKLFEKMKSNVQAKLPTKVLSSEFDAVGLEVHFRTDPIQFQKLLQAQFFDALCLKPDDKGQCKISVGVGKPSGGPQ